MAANVLNMQTVELNHRKISANPERVITMKNISIIIMGGGHIFCKDEKVQ